MSEGTSAEAPDANGAELSGVGCTGGFGIRVHPRYHEAYQPSPGEQISDRAECPDCGHTSADFGRWRRAQPHEAADEDGEIYECSYCGETRIIPPLPNMEGSRADE